MGRGPPYEKTATVGWALAHHGLYRDLPGKRDVTGSSYRDRAALRTAVRSLEHCFASQDVHGYLLLEYIPHERSLGHELLLGAHWTEDFGPVVTFGPGGIYTEFLAASLKTGRGVALMSPGLTAPEDLEAILAGKALTPLITGRLRGRAWSPRVRLSAQELPRAPPLPSGAGALRLLQAPGA